MAKKRLVLNEPKFGMTGSYNFPNGYDAEPPDYNLSTGLPKNNDKFQRKDLYTTSQEDELHTAIVNRNLKFQAGTSYIRIDDIYISEATGKKAGNNRAWIWMFSEKRFEDKPVNFDSDGYNNIHYYLYGQDSCGILERSRNEIDGGKNWGHLIQNQNILTRLNELPLEIEDYDDNKITNDDTDDTGYNATFSMGLRGTTLYTKIIDENVYNPIYFVVRLRGDETEGAGTDIRKRRYQVFKINNFDLFDYDDSGQASGKITTFDENNILPLVNTTDGEGGGYGDEAAKWKINSGDFKVTINTIGSVLNDWEGAADEADGDDEKKYAKYFDSVEPQTIFNPNDLQSFLSISPYRQLFNNFGPGDLSIGNGVYRKYIPITTISIAGQDNILTQGVDVQSYYEDNEELSLQGSAPSTINYRLRTVEGIVGTSAIDDNYYYDIDIIEDYFYFIIDWDDKDDTIKTLEDWMNTRPTNLSELQELQDNNLYKLYRKETQLPEMTITSYGDDTDSSTFPNPYELFPDALPFEYIDNDTTPPYLHHSIINPFDVGPETKYARGEPTGDKACQILGHTGVADIPVGEINFFPQDAFIGFPQWNGEEWVQNQEESQYFYPRLDCYDLPSNSVPTNTYNTAGIKTIKAIMFSYDDSSGYRLSTGRWKLITTRFYLDIPINQYPDFGELGGSDYTTIPWPYTTPIIGGMDENSKYKISVQDTLSSGKIGDTDIIDEKFLVNDLENDEMGQSVRKIDLEQVRYFNVGSYDMNTLLGINPIGEITFDNQYLENSHLSTLLFPQYFEEFDVSENGELTSEDSDIWNNDYGRPDIANQIMEYISDFEEWQELPDEYFIGTIQLQFSHNNPDQFSAGRYWGGALGECANDDQWEVLYPPGVYDSYAELLAPGGDFTLDRTPELACELYFPEDCQGLSCTAVSFENCDSSYNSGTIKAYDCIIPNEEPSPLPPNYPEGEPVLGDNIITNGDFSTLTFDEDFQPYYLSEWTIFDGGIGSVEYYAGGIRFQVLSTYRLQSASQDVLTPGKTYVFTYDVISIQSTDDGDNNLHLEVGGADIEIPNTEPVLEFGENMLGNTLTFVAEGTNFIIKGGGTNIDVTLDNIMVQEFSPPELSIDFEQYYNEEYFNSAIQLYTPYNDSFWDGDMNKFPMESSVGQIFISDNQDLQLKEDCQLELNTGELSGKSIIDSSGNSNKGLLIGDYKVKKNRKGEPMRRDSFIKVPKKTNNRNGAL